MMLAPVGLIATLYLRVASGVMKLIHLAALRTKGVFRVWAAQSPRMNRPDLADIRKSDIPK